MDASQYTLIATLVATQVALWGAYAVQLGSYGSAALWGRIGPRMRTYFAATAAIAYLCHLGVGVYLVAAPRARPWQRYAFAAGAAAYYVLQLFFLPLLRRAIATSDRMAVRVLLGACIVPMALCAAAGIGTSDVAVGVAATLPLVHVAVNDFAAFGFTF